MPTTKRKKRAPIYELPPGYRIEAIHTFPKNRRAFVLGRNPKTELVYMFVFNRDKSYDMFVHAIPIWV